MKNHFALIIVAFALLSCDKDQKTIRTYVYTQGLEEGQIAKLFIDDEFVSELSNSEFEPVLCVDSTLLDCFQIELPFGEHNYKLATQSSIHICSGYIKVKPNKTTGGTRIGQSGSMSSYLNREQDMMLVGMNTIFDPNQNHDDCE